MRNTLGILLFFLFVLCACAQEGERAAPTVARVSNPAAPGARQPSAAPGAGRHSALLSWLEPVPGNSNASERNSGAMRLVWASYDGTLWSEPELIAAGRDFFVNWADFPSLATAHGTPVAAHWLQRVPGGTYAYHVNMTFRSPSGTWSDALTPHLDRSATEHGFASMVPLEGEGVLALWLDGYKTLESATSAEGDVDASHEPHASGAGLATAMTLRSAIIHPDGRRGEELEIDGSVCDCCQTSAARSGNRVVAVYRNRTSEEIRDIYRALYDLESGRWSEPAALSTDSWRIAGCPVNGPQVAAVGETVIATWFSAPEGRAVSYFAVSQDGGLSFTEPQALHQGVSVGRVGVAFNHDGAALLSWIGSDAVVHGRIWRETGIGDDFVLGEIDASRASGFPRATGLGAGFLVAWTEPGSGIRTVLVTPPAE